MASYPGPKKKKKSNPKKLGKGQQPALQLVGLALHELTSSAFQLDATSPCVWTNPGFVSIPGLTITSVQIVTPVVIQYEFSGSFVGRSVTVKQGLGTGWFGGVTLGFSTTL